MGSARFKIERRYVKLVLPSVGLLAAYVGGGLAMLLTASRLHPFFAVLLSAFVGLGAGLGAMIPLDRHFGEDAKHVDLLKILYFWSVAGVALYVIDWVVENTMSRALPPFISNLTLLIAGILAVWVDEPR